ncbi:MAG: hypothetical protein Q9218_001414 [Villophora microphyllina]
MARTKRNETTKPSLTNEAQIEEGSGNICNTTKEPHRPVTVTPFTVNMFKQMDVQPNASPLNHPVMTPVISIRPESVWNSLKKYRNFMMKGKQYSVHQYAKFLRYQPLPKERHPLDTDLEISCIARILEIRAKDPQNVYVRVYWLYQPEETPGGRQVYHGHGELIATNHMEIVDALRCVRHVEVIHLVDDTVPPKTANVHDQEEGIDPLTLDVGTHPLPRKTRKSVISPFQSQPNIAIDIIVSQRADHRGQKRLLYTDRQEKRSWEMDIHCLVCTQRI